jgi:5-methyltetrahydrofolate--homocysteine methyltransferase
MPSEDEGFDVVKAINALQEDQVIAWVEDQLGRDVAPNAIVEHLAEGLRVLGDRFATGEVFIPELAVGGKIFTRAMDVLRPAMEASGEKLERAGTMLIGTVQGDLHDLGKNLVATMFVTKGFEVINLGNDVAVEDFVAGVRDNRPQIVGMSALLTTTMEVQREVIEALQAAGLRHEVKVMVGGAPVNQRWADEIGADAFASDAIDGLRKARAMLGLN